eukprot:9176657-Pyramimonas_sp.AAC.1
MARLQVGEAGRGSTRVSGRSGGVCAPRVLYNAGSRTVNQRSSGGVHSCIVQHCVLRDALCFTSAIQSWDPKASPLIIRCTTLAVVQ